MLIGIIKHWTKMLKVAAAQIRVINDTEKNLDKIIYYIKKAASKNVDIICFPETSLIHSKNKKAIKRIPIKNYINIIKIWNYPYEWTSL